MQCKNHPSENGINTCNNCGSWLCERCSFERGGRIFCPSCAVSQGTEAATAHYPPRSTPARNISWGLLFLFSVVIMLPGLNYMYMGLIKRGLLAMSAFFGVIFLGTQLSGALSWLFAFAIPILVIACIFDGFNIRRRINAGEAVSDSVDDVMNFIRRNRVIILGVLVLFLVIHIIGALWPWIMIAAIILAAVILFKPKTK